MTARKASTPTGVNIEVSAGAGDRDAAYITRAPAYRLPAATRLGPVRLQVADLKRSLDYYHHVLGLHVLDQQEGSARLGPVGEDVELLSLSELRGASPHPYNGRLGLYHFAILLPSRAALARFVAHLAEINAYAGQADHAVSEAFYLRDPDGLGIEVYADRPRSQWPVVNGKLAMGLDPVDMQGLLREAGDAKWEGMPAGTRIGHVHLHVGTIPEAEKFFHKTLGLDITADIPSALFMSAGGYHPHLGTNIWAGSSPSPSQTDARLIEWTLLLPGSDDASRVAEALKGSGYSVKRDGEDWLAADPWGTNFRIIAEP
jgi:catechol 2,3-dioxygenase